MYRLALGRHAVVTRNATGRTGLVREAGLEDLAWTLFNSSEFLYVR